MVERIGAVLPGGPGRGTHRVW